MSSQRDCLKGTYSLASALADFGANTLAIVHDVGEALGLAEIGDAELGHCRSYLIDILRTPTPIPVDAVRLCVYLCTQSRSILESLILEWLQDLSKLVKSENESSILRVECLKSITELLALSLSATTDIKRTVSGSFVPKLLVFVLEESELPLQARLSACAALVRNFPNTVKHSTTQVESFYVRQLDACPEVILQNPNVNLAELALCFGKKESSTSWSDITAKVLGSASKTCQSLFRSIQEEPFDQSIDSQNKFLSLSDNELPTMTSRHHLLRRLHALFQWLGQLLLLPMTTAIEIPVRPLLGLLGRIVSADGRSPVANEKHRERELLMLLLPSIYRCALRLLRDLVNVLRKHLLGYLCPLAQLMSRFTLLSIEFPQLKEELYSTAISFVDSFGSSAEVLLSDKFWGMLRCDLEPPAVVSSKAPVPKNKKQKQNDRDAKASTDLKGAMVAERLKLGFHVLEACLQCPKLVSSTQLVRLGQLMARHCLLIESLVPSQPLFANSPYSCPSVRMSLIRVMRAFVLVSSPIQVRVLPIALRLFSRNLSDRDPAVRSLCRDGSAVCETLMHPRLPCLFRPNVDAVYVGKDVEDQPSQESISEEGAEKLPQSTVVEMGRPDAGGDGSFIPASNSPLTAKRNYQAAFVANGLGSETTGKVPESTFSRVVEASIPRPVTASTAAMAVEASLTPSVLSNAVPVKAVPVTPVMPIQRPVQAQNRPPSSESPHLPHTSMSAPPPRPHAYAAGSDEDPIPDIIDASSESE